MPVSDIPNPIDVLTDAVQDTCFDHPDRFDPLKRDIRQLVRSLAPAVKVSGLAQTVRDGVYFMKSMNPRRRDIIAEFFSAFSDDVTAADLAKAMECI